MTETQAQEAARFEATVRKGYADGFRPKHFRLYDLEDDGPCGCVLGAALHGSGVGAAFTTTGGGVDCLARQFPQLGNDFMWGAVYGYDRHVVVGRHTENPVFLAGYALGRKFDTEEKACGTDSSPSSGSV